MKFCVMLGDFMTVIEIDFITEFLLSLILIFLVMGDLERQETF